SLLRGALSLSVRKPYALPSLQRVYRQVTARIIRHVDDTLAVSVEQGWGPRVEFVPLSLEGASALIGEQLLEIQPLSGGARNTNYRLLRMAQPEPVVLRIHTADPTACRREQQLLHLVRDSVPVPRVLRVG